MNSLDDLRATLEADADRAGLAPADDRAGAVHGRIRVMKRRRRVAGGAAVATLGVAVLWGLPGLIGLSGSDDSSRDDTSTLVAGQRVAEQVEIHSFDYRLDRALETEPGAEELTVPVGTTPARRAVRLAADSLPPGASATLRDSGGRVLAQVSDAGRFDAPVPVSDEETVVLTVEGAKADTVVGVAVYERTDSLPSGVAAPDGGSVFRAQVADRTLLDGAYLDPAVGQATFTVEGELRDIDFSTYCDSNGRRVHLVTEVDGKLLSSARCDDRGALDEDPAGVLRNTGHLPGSTHTVRFWTTDREFSRTVVPAPEAVAGLAAYTAGERTGDGTTEVVTEWGGYLWRLDDTLGATARIDPTEPVLVGFRTDGKDPVWMNTSVDGDRVRRSAGTDTGSLIDGVLWPGSTYDLELDDTDDGQILTYRLVR